MATVYPAYRADFLARANTRLREIDKDGSLFEDIKQQLRKGVNNKRTFIGLATLEEVIDRLEAELAIDEEEGKFEVFGRIAQVIRDPELKRDTEDFMAKAKPPVHAEPSDNIQQNVDAYPLNRVAVTPAQSNPGGRKIPEFIKQEICAHFQMQRSLEWRHFLGGLGKTFDYPYNSVVNIQERLLDQLDSKPTSTAAKVAEGLAIFESRCARYEQLDSAVLVNHLCDVLADENVLDPPYRRTASKVREIFRNYNTPAIAYNG